MTYQTIYIINNGHKQELIGMQNDANIDLNKLDLDFVVSDQYVRYV
jgi:hypothetical protein